MSLNVGPIRTKIRENSVPHFDKHIKPLVPTSVFKSYYEKKFMAWMDGGGEREGGGVAAAAA